MRWVVPRLVLLYGVLAILGGALVALARAHPSQWVARLRMDVCEMPCWLDIVPGQTALDDARRRVEAEFGGDSFRVEHEVFDPYWSRYTVTYHDNRDTLMIYLNTVAGDGVVQGIGLGFTSPSGMPPRIPDLYGALGSPTAIRQQIEMGDRITTNVWFREGRVYVDLGYQLCGAVRLTSAIHNLYLRPSPTSFHVSERWRGFGRCYFPGELSLLGGA